jgi:fatty acid desaturase
MDLDPDVDIPLLAFEEEQALEKRGFARSVVKYQAALIFPLSLLQAISMLRSSIEFLAAKKAKSTLVEALMICAHFALYFGLLFSVLEPLQTLLFIAVHRGLFGTYMVLIFAPNHKAMPLLERDSKVDFLRRQVLTSRNVIAHPITDFWYGGLNYQIEHHLFPRLPRNIFTRSAHRCEKQERRGEGAADQAHIEYEQIDTPTGKPLQENEPHRAVRQRI